MNAVAKWMHVDRTTEAARIYCKECLAVKLIEKKKSTLYLLNSLHAENCDKCKVRIFFRIVNGGVQPV